jgi:hypothetical protein
MTAEDNKRDDAEFEAFLQGRGELARKLQGLPQPSPSAALDAAILAQAEVLAAAAAAAPVSGAANDALAPNTAKPRKPHFMMRWSTQLAMAASVVLATLVTLRWQNEPVMEPAEQAEKIEQPAQDAQAPQTEPSAPPVASKPHAAPAASRPKAAKQDAPPVAPAPAPTQAKTSVPEADSNAQLGPTETAIRQNYAAAPEPFARKEAADARVRAIVVPAPSAAVAAAPAPSAPAPAVVQAKPEVNAKAEAWLSVIEEMIKAGLRRDAQEEWEKFDKTYPAYPVPEKLREQIKTLEK